MDEFTDLDELVDRYLRDEQYDKPNIGFPSRAAGTSLFRASRQWEKEDPDEVIGSAEMAAMEGAFASLTVEQETILRLDAGYRAKGIHRIDTSGVDAVKKILRRLLNNRGIVV